MPGGRGRFVGIGVGSYTNERHRALPRAVPDVEQFGALLDAQFDGAVLRDPTESAVRTHLQEVVKGSLPDRGSLVLLWSGHGVGPRADELQLLGTDSDVDDVSGLSIREVVGNVVRSGADQVLLIVDTCFSGGALPATQVAAGLMDAKPPDSDHLWVGVLAACSAIDTAVDGRLGTLLRGLLTDGPTTRTCVGGGRRTTS